VIYFMLNFVPFFSLICEKAGVPSQAHAAAVGIVEQIPQCRAQMPCFSSEFVPLTRL
jgi:hypothetical protein